MLSSSRQQGSEALLAVTVCAARLLTIAGGTCLTGSYRRRATIGLATAGITSPPLAAKLFAPRPDRFDLGLELLLCCLPVAQSNVT